MDIRTLIVDKINFQGSLKTECAIKDFTGCKECEGSKYKCKKSIALEAFTKASDIDLRYLHNPSLCKLNANLPGADKEAIKQVNKYRLNIADCVASGNFNLLLASPKVGNGKTTGAISIGMRYIQEAANKCSLDDQYRYIFPVLFVSWPEYVFERNLCYTDNKSYKGLYKGINWRDYIELMKNVELLILDDIGCTNTNKTELDTLYFIADYRYKNKKSTIYTSNVDPGQLQKLLGDRVYDRAFPQGTKIVVFKDNSHRKSASIDDQF